MKKLNLLLLFIIAAFSLHATSFSGDTSFVPSIRYTKEELKKEMKDLKTLDKQCKEWNKAVKENNPDYINVVFSKTMALLEKEHAELNNRVSIRSKQLYPSTMQTKSAMTEDKPRVYNPELKDQIVHVNKEEIMRKKAESEYLNNYIDVIRNEKTLITKLKTAKSFDDKTSATTYAEINADLQAFKKEMAAEIALMKKETGKMKK